METVPPFDLDAYAARSGGLDFSEIAWDDVAGSPVPPAAVRTLRYMQDIEAHTIVYLRALLATRAIDEPEIAVFLARWLYEETGHGLALGRFLAAAGHPVAPRAHGREPFSQRIEGALTSMVSRAWRDFCAVHMTWGAINELTALTAYRRLAALARHPVLDVLLDRIARDEARHFLFYYRQAAQRLARPAVARVARLLVDRFWAPVGSGVQPREETLFMARYLFGGSAGQQAARQVDEPIRRLPGFSGAGLLEGWIDRFAVGGMGDRGEC